MKKIAFFDFCDTLVSFQTADAYVDFVRKAEGKFYMKCLNSFMIILCKVRVIAIFNKFFPGAAIGKRIKLLQLRGLTFDKLDNLAASYYREMIRPNLVKPSIAEMKSLTQLDYEVCLVSAGYNIYLKYFASEYQIKHIISSEISFNNNRCRGILTGKDCITHEKVRKIKSYFKDDNINLGDCISYSDSMSDLPMLLLTGKGVVVSRFNSQLWSQNFKFKEIIWD